ncbi:titin, putative [Ixodes scapularis]|uniref:Titin, putative n=1 Tax=Ixodes scapularis TaxID=6945 RepID=B7QG14_IXOSC|nr:titin, putative [Ixodes scapularis]|eukprot:XP_002401096.1 titin, putative [Ixodes scapularis]
MIAIEAASTFIAVASSSAQRDKPQIQPFSFPPNVNLGEKASLTCVAARGSGPFQFTWTQDGKPIINTASKYARTVVDDIATMTIEKVSAEDVGNYTCTVSNGAGRDTASASLMVEVERRASDWTALQPNERYERAAPSRHSEKPDIQPFSFSKNIALGQKASVACVVIGGSEPFHFEWTHNGKMIVNKASKYVRENMENIATLTIQKVSAEDVGNYTCAVSNSFGKDSHSASLVVEGRPDVMPFSFSANSALDQKSTVSCVVTFGQGPFDFLWTQDGKIIEDSPRKHTKTLAENVAVMTIEKVTAEDLGNYTCTVANAAGSSSHSATLAIEGQKANKWLSQMAPKLQEFFPSHTALGQKSQVSCVVYEDNGHFTFTCKKDGLPLEHGPGTAIRQVTEAASLLMLDAVTVGDIGKHLRRQQWSGKRFVHSRPPCT